MKIEEWKCMKTNIQLFNYCFAYALVSWPNVHTARAQSFGCRYQGWMNHSTWQQKKRSLTQLTARKNSTLERKSTIQTQDPVSRTSFPVSEKLKNKLKAKFLKTENKTRRTTCMSEKEIKQMTKRANWLLTLEFVSTFMSVVTFLFFSWVLTSAKNRSPFLDPDEVITCRTWKIILQNNPNSK